MLPSLATRAAAVGEESRCTVAGSLDALRDYGLGGAGTLRVCGCGWWEDGEGAVGLGNHVVLVCAGARVIRLRGESVSIL